MIQNYSNRKGQAPAIALGALALIGAAVEGYLAINKDSASKPSKSFSVEYSATGNTTKTFGMELPKRYQIGNRNIISAQDVTDVEKTVQAEPTQTVTNTSLDAVIGSDNIIAGGNVSGAQILYVVPKEQGTSYQGQTKILEGANINPTLNVVFGSEPKVAPTPKPAPKPTPKKKNGHWCTGTDCDDCCDN